MNKKDPKFEILFNSIKYGKKILKNEFISEERRESVEKTLKQCEDLVKYISDIESENDKLKNEIKEKDARISALCNPPHRGVYE